MSLNKVFVAGVTVAAAADWNGLQAAWDDYTPTWTAATTPPAIGNGTLTGKYLRIGKLIIVRITIVAGATTTQGTGGQSIALPVAAHATGEQGLHLKLFTGSANYVGNANIAAGASTLQPYVPTSSGDCSLVQMASVNPNIGTGGNVVIEGAYEAA